MRCNQVVYDIQDSTNSSSQVYLDVLSGDTVAYFLLLQLLHHYVYQERLVNVVSHNDRILR